jgi:hypothetical protein
MERREPSTGIPWNHKPLDFTNQVVYAFVNIFAGTPEQGIGLH